MMENNKTSKKNQEYLNWLKKSFTKKAKVHEIEIRNIANKINQIQEKIENTNEEKQILENLNSL